MDKSAYLIAVSKAIDAKSVFNAKEVLMKWGYDVRFSDSITSNYLGYAGRPDDRAKQVNSAYKDKRSQVIFTAMGGMGAVHIAHLVDYEAIKGSNKVLVGYSDITILLNAIYQKTGARCVHGPNLGKSFDRYDERTLVTLFKVLGKCDYDSLIDKGDVFSEGVAKASIVGGNIRLIVRSLGTPYEIDTKGKILFFEAVNKDGQWLYDNLWQLKLAGKFDDIKGIIVGHLTDCGEDALEFIKDFFRDFKCPVIFNQPIGHNEPNLSVPIGEECVIDTEMGYWGIRFI